MKFEDKLQKLRKEKGLSQEQLAEQLSVTRQSVSKWESGQSYPEMDKLLLICKIFDCSLDELTNDTINVETINTKSPMQKGTKFINNFLNDVNRAIDKFKSMSNSEIKRCLLELFIIIIVLSIIHAPLSDVLNIGYFSNYDAINSIWNVIASLIDFAYFIFSLFVIFYVFKTRYLDDDKVIVKEFKEVKKAKKVVVEEETEEKEHNPWKMIVVGFIKFILICIAFPIMMSVFGLIVAFFAILFLTIDGINLAGPLLIILALIIAFSALSNVLWNIIFSIKKNYRRIFASFIIFSVFFSVGTLFSTIEATKYTYYDAIPNEVTKSTTSKEIVFNSNYHLSDDLTYDYDISYTINNQLQNNMIIKVTYYSTYTNPTIEVNNNQIDINMIGNEIRFGSQIYKEIKNDLIQHRIYNYAKLYSIKIDIIGSEANINQLRYNIINN